MTDRLGEHYQRYSKQSVAEYNGFEYDANDYRHVYHGDYNEQLSTQQEVDIQYDKVDYYLAVSSRDRNIDIHPNVNQYTLDLPHEFRNIYSIELLQSIIPDKNNVTSEPYLLLKIDELEDVMFSNDRNISDAFAILQIANPTSNGGFIYMDKKIHERTVKYFRIPKASLSKMTVSIRDYKGDLFDFGSDSPSPPLKSMQNTFVFKIVCLEKQRKQLGHRNVF